MYKPNPRTIKYVLLEIVAVFALMFFNTAGYSFGGEYFVSPTGSASWAACVNRNTPCSANTAMLYAAAGDTVYFLDGTYEVGARPDNDSGWQHNALEPSNSGSASAPIIFKSENSLGAVLKGTNNVDEQSANVVGVNNVDYIIFDGFKVSGVASYDFGGGSAGDSLPSQIVLWVASNCIVKNCDINGGETTLSGTPNVSGVRIQNCSNADIQNNKIYNFRNSTDDANTTGILSYQSRENLVENNTIYNCSAGYNNKQGPQWGSYNGVGNDIIRKNFIYNCAYGFHIESNAVGDNSGHKYYQNILANLTLAAFSHNPGSDECDDIQIYNNTLYNTTRGINYSSGDNWQFWNNIIIGTSSKQALAGSRAKAQPTYSDYNDFYNGEVFRVFWYEASQAEYNSLSSWSSSGQLIGGGNPDAHSYNHNPNIDNPGGTSAEDYKRTSYPTDGRGDSYASVMGAYITGDETIGVSARITTSVSGATISGATIQ